MRKILVIFGCTTIYLLGISKFLNIYKADVAYTKGNTFITESAYQKALNQMELATTLNPKEPAYLRGQAKALLASTVESQSVEDTKLKALESLERALQLNPTNLVTIRNSLPLYYYLGLKDLKDPANPNNIDAAFIPAIRKFYTETKQDYPNDAGIFVSIAKYENRLGLEEDYNQSIERIRELRLDLLEWHKDLIEAL